MMYHLFLRAFFDKYGSFHGVDQTIFGEALMAGAKGLNVPLTEFCYREIGYEADELFTAQDRCQRRMAAVCKDKVKELDLFQNIKTTKSAMKKAKIQPFFQCTSVEVDDDVKDIVCTVANFIEHTEMIAAVEAGDKITSLADAFFPLKLAGNEAQLEAWIPGYSNIVKSILLNAKVDKNAEYSYAAAGKVVLKSAPNDLEALAAQVCRQIGRRSMDMPSEHYYFVANNATYYQMSNPAKKQIYLCMLDLAAVYSMTVAQLVDFIGFSFVDQLAIYGCTGYFIYELPGAKYMCIDPMEPESKIELSYVELRSLYDPQGGRLNV